jgi:hypothetical protein
VSAWSYAAVQAIERAFVELVERAESHDRCDPDDPDGAIAALVALEDHEVPAASRLDLMIAQHARCPDARVVRAVARLFAACQLPDRRQPPRREAPVDEADDGAPFDLALHLEQQPATATLFRSGLELEPADLQLRASLPERWPPRRIVHPLTAHTLLAMHVRTLRTYARTLHDDRIVRECDELLAGPRDPWHRTMELRRHLSALYNAFLLQCVESAGGHWTAEAVRDVGYAFARFFSGPEPDAAWLATRVEPVPAFPDPTGDDLAIRVEPVPDSPDPTGSDPPPTTREQQLLREVHTLLEDVLPDDVDDRAVADLQRVQAATAYDLASVRAMGRLYIHALEWELTRLRDEIGRPRREAN